MPDSAMRSHTRQQLTDFASCCIQRWALMLIAVLLPCLMTGCASRTSIAGGPAVDGDPLAATISHLGGPDAGSDIDEASLHRSVSDAINVLAAREGSSLIQDREEELFHVRLGRVVHRTPELIASLGDESDATVDLAGFRPALGRGGQFSELQGRLDAIVWQEEEATATTASSEEEGSQDGEDLDTLGNKQINPMSDLWSLVFQYDATVTDNAATDESLGHSLKFQPVLPIDLTEDIRLITRPVFRLYESREVPSGTFNDDRDRGLGDTNLISLLGPATKEAGGFFWGVGTSWSFPTATEDSLGSEQWAVGPAFTTWYFGKPWIFGLVAQSFFSFAEEDSDRDSTNLLDFQVFILYDFAPGWKIGMTPNITFDLDEDELALPLGLGVTTTVKVGNTPIRVLFETQYYIVNDFGGEPEWNFRILIAPIVGKPSVFREPLF